MKSKQLVLKSAVAGAFLYTAAQGLPVVYANLMGGIAVNAAEDAMDVGSRHEALLRAQSQKWFGVVEPLTESAPKTSGAYRTVDQTAAEQVDLATGLSVEYLSREVADKWDMYSFWPSDDAATHIISCIEGGRETLVNGKMNPSVQAISLDDGTVTTVLRGMNRCDGLRTTGWGSVLATEETSDGGAYEIRDPLNNTELTLVARGASDVVDAGGVPVAGIVAFRDALPTMAWEGLTVLPSGVVIGGDELRPGTGTPDADGGAIFKFVPETIRTGNGTIASLDDSPYTAGSVYALQASCREASSSSYGQHGQGCEIGHSRWIRVDALNARESAYASGATGFYRPEDLHRDPLYHNADYPDAVRFCWANTGREKADSFGEVICAIDFDPAMTNPDLPNKDDNVPQVSMNRFVEGDEDFNSFDNLAFQPVTGNVYVIEDHSNGDVFACLPDGLDRDVKSDGCVKILSVRDSSAEPTGFMFSADGTKAYVAIQHSNDDNMPLVDGYGTDDFLVISGFTVN